MSHFDKQTGHNTNKAMIVTSNNKEIMINKLKCFTTFLRGDLAVLFISYCKVLKVVLLGSLGFTQYESAFKPFTRIANAMTTCALLSFHVNQTEVWLSVAQFNTLRRWTNTQTRNLNYPATIEVSFQSENINRVILLLSYPFLCYQNQDIATVISFT